MAKKPTKLISYHQAGTRLGVSEASIRRLVNKGIFKVTEVVRGSRTFYMLKESDVLLEAARRKKGAKA